jgi:TonB family protein
MPLRGPVSTSPDAANAVDGAQAPPRAPAAGAPAGAIIALSDDPLLLEALTGAALADSAVITSPSTDRFIDQLVANAPGIALIDASSVSTPLKGFIATLREQFPQLLLILTGPAQLQAQLSAQIDDGTIFRFVHKPASSQRLKLFIDSALRQQALPEFPIERPMAAAALRAAAPEPPAGGRGGLALAAGLSGAALAAGAIAWAVWHEGSPPTPSKPAPADSAATAAPSPSPQRDQPAGDAQVARDAAARDAQALEQAQRSALSARADQLSVYLQLARKRLGSGALIEPADDSARAYLASALALAPEDAEVRATSIALGEALIAQFRHALAAGDSAGAQRWLQACSDYRINSTTLNQLSAQLQQTNEQGRLQREFNQRMAAVALIEPAEDSALSKYSPVSTAPTQTPANAPPVAAPADVLVSESSLTRVRFVPPVYPDDALAHGISGWVDLEFTVTGDGKVADIVVLNAEPSGVFERAARAALANSRYRPVQRDGVPVAQRTRIRMRFQQ